ncbi:MAG: hypothetical protein ACI83W_000779 [Marinoscillum sp.]|jgi:hypothetical protein
MPYCNNEYFQIIGCFYKDNFMNRDYFYEKFNNNI